MGKRLFLYHFELDHWENPPRTIGQFAEALGAYFRGRGLDYGMSALGGMFHCRGCVFGREDGATEADRRELAEWARRQRLRCTARLGALEEDHDDLPLFREITEWIFRIDNLTEEDRAEAAAWHEDIRTWVRESRD